MVVPKTSLVTTDVWLGVIGGSLFDNKRGSLVFGSRVWRSTDWKFGCGGGGNKGGCICVTNGWVGLVVG